MKEPRCGLPDTRLSDPMSTIRDFHVYHYCGYLFSSHFLTSVKHLSDCFLNVMYVYLFLASRVDSRYLDFGYLE